MRISLRNVTKTFGDVVANDHLSLEIEEGELFTLLGPSGCGKTTTLRIVAGFYYPDEGTVFFDDQDVTRLPPDRRGTGMVFQNYALWPHMSVFDNVAYGLKIRKTPKDVIQQEVKAALDLVRLSGLEVRTPFQLSGGQQQRVALARALVIRPRVLLLDEPLSNLDAKLRLEMRQEITRIQRTLDITTIYVTHDQEEALSISDRIAVQRNGALQQVDSPQQIYANPINAFVADFIGQCSFLYGTVQDLNGDVAIATDVGVPLKARKTRELAPGDAVLCAIRPENFSLTKPDEEANVVDCEVLSVLFLGKSNRVHAKIGDLRLLAELPTDTPIASGDLITLYVKVDETTVLPFTA